MGKKRNTREMSLPILDSKLISATSKELYYIKLVDCGTYIQVYYYPKGKVRDKKDKSFDDLDLRKQKVFDSIGSNQNQKETKNELRHIEPRNIIRSKLECQRIAKANMNDWETFITLTFEENITDVKQASKRFKYFVDKIRRVKKDFKYLCITEFQKRGATHYHLLTNISINDETLIYAQEDNKSFLHIKYWIDGFTSVQELKNDPKKVIGYIAKYMTKNIDQRLFSHHRYFCSQNLKKPKESFINTANDKDLDFYKKIIQDSSLIYQSEYINPRDSSKVQYLEYLKNE